MSSINVGVVGYSGTNFDKLKGMSLVRKAFDELQNQFGSNITIVSGYINLGIPYQETYACFPS